MARSQLASYQAMASMGFLIAGAALWVSRSGSRRVLVPRVRRAGLFASLLETALLRCVAMSGGLSAARCRVLSRRSARPSARAERRRQIDASVARSGRLGHRSFGMMRSWLASMIDERW